ncbi:MAG: hypothetical protein AMJ58_09720 [Gammaproteobacteria bacterium SG8_30]|nr:MAG: hypothetical protein AMJ58_09720 [Gammaproteobacteria bacterium SG8_30]
MQRHLPGVSPARPQARGVLPRGARAPSWRRQPPRPRDFPARTPAALRAAHHSGRRGGRARARPCSHGPSSRTSRTRR